MDSSLLDVAKLEDCIVTRRNIWYAWVDLDLLSLLVNDLADVLQRLRIVRNEVSLIDLVVEFLLFLHYALLLCRLLFVAHIVRQSFLGLPFLSIDCQVGSRYDIVVEALHELSLWRFLLGLNEVIDLEVGGLDSPDFLLVNCFYRSDQIQRFDDGFFLIVALRSWFEEGLVEYSSERRDVGRCTERHSLQSLELSRIDRCTVGNVAVLLDIFGVQRAQVWWLQLSSDLRLHFLVYIDGRQIQDAFERRDLYGLLGV